MSAEPSDLRSLQRSLEAPPALRARREALLAAARARERGPGDWFDAPDAVAADLWWLLLASVDDGAAPPVVWADADGRSVACEAPGGGYGLWIERGGDGELLLVRAPDGGVAVGFSQGDTVLVADPAGWWRRGAVEREAVAWEQSRGGTRWTPATRHTIAYGDDALPAAVHTHYEDGGVPLTATLYERPVALPAPEELAERARADLLAATRQALGAAGGRLWYELDEDGVTAAYVGFDAAADVEALVAPPDDVLGQLELPTVAPWSRTSFVEAYQRRERDRGALRELALGVGSELNTELEREHGSDGPVLLVFPFPVGPDPHDAAAVLTPGQRATWEERGWWASLEAWEGDL